MTQCFTASKRQNKKQRKNNHNWAFICRVVQSDGWSEQVAWVTGLANSAVSQTDAFIFLFWTSQPSLTAPAFLVLNCSHTRNTQNKSLCHSSVPSGMGSAAHHVRGQRQDLVLQPGPPAALRVWGLPGRGEVQGPGCRGEADEDLPRCGEWTEPPCGLSPEGLVWLYHCGFFPFYCKTQEVRRLLNMSLVSWTQYILNGTRCGSHAVQAKRSRCSILMASFS